MSSETTQVRTARDVIRRLRALAAEIDQAVSAAARVRADLHRTLTSIRCPALGQPAQEHADRGAELDAAALEWLPSARG